MEMDLKKVKRVVSTALELDQADLRYVIDRLSNEFVNRSQGQFKVAVPASASVQPSAPKTNGVDASAAN